MAKMDSVKTEILTSYVQVSRYVKVGGLSQSVLQDIDLTLESTDTGLKSLHVLVCIFIENGQCIFGA